MPSGRDDTFRDTLNTAAVWQVIRDYMAADRANVNLHLLKRLYKVGCGAGFVRGELITLQDEKIFSSVRAQSFRKYPVLPSGRRTQS